MTFHNLSLASAVVFLFGILTSVVSSEEAPAPRIPPTCSSLGSDWYFPNSCVFSCEDTFGTTMDVQRSRNVGGDFKCFCVDQELPFCTDDPLCSYLGISPETATEDCARACGGDGEAAAATERALDAVSTVTVDDNGYQFHYVLSCSCDGGATKTCGDDFVLFTDTDYMKSCSKGGSNGIDVFNEEQCENYCLGTNVFSGSEFADEGRRKKTCSCVFPGLVDLAGNSSVAIACDDATARENDGDGLGNPCYAEIGVSESDCVPSAAPLGKHAAPPTAKTLVSSTAIMGVWLLPW